MKEIEEAILRKLYRLIMTVFLSGCISQIASVEDSSKGWIGRPLSQLKDVIWSSKSSTYAERIGWQEQTYRLENGHLVYVEPVRPDCLVHWETDSQGIIVGYRTEGSRCY